MHFAITYSKQNQTCLCWSVFISYADSVDVLVVYQHIAPLITCHCHNLLLSLAKLRAITESQIPRQAGALQDVCSGGVS